MRAKSIVLFFFLAFYVNAAITLPSLFTNGVVLQQNSNVAVWGWASAGKTISVTPSWNNQTYIAVADSEGYWMTKITTPAGSSNAYTIIFSDNPSDSQTISGVLIGEVWICSGQSNMEMLVRATDNASEEADDANYPLIKIFKVPYKASYVPEKDVDASWVAPTSETILNSYFSAIPFFFSRNLYKTLNVPIGILQISRGSASQGSWLSEENIKGAEYAENVLREALEGNMPELEQHIPTVLFNGMFKPLIPYTVKGVCWYQGEYDVVQPQEYKILLDNFINSWRIELGQSELPFLITQLSGYAERNNEAWTSVQETQYRISQKYSNVATVLTYDIGNPNDIHPANKQDVAHRMCLAARKIAYKEDILYQGPSVKTITINGSTVGLSYRDVGSGLVLREGYLANNFMLAGSNKLFYNAQASIVSTDSIVLFSLEVPSPQYVRYAYKNYNSSVNLYNSAGIPAVPFRTDTTFIFISTQSGDWSNESTWGRKGVPCIDDDVVVTSGHTVTNYVSGETSKDLCKALVVNGTLYIGSKTQSNYIINVYEPVVCNGKIELGEAVKGAYLTFKGKAGLIGTGTATFGSIILAAGYTNCLIDLPSVKAVSSLQITQSAAKFIIGAGTNIQGHNLSPSSTAGQSNNYGYYDIYGKATFNYVYLCNNYTRDLAKNKISVKREGELKAVIDITPLRNGSAVKGVGGSGTVLSVEEAGVISFPPTKDPIKYTISTNENYDKNLSVNYYKGSVVNGEIMTDNHVSNLTDVFDIKEYAYYDQSSRKIVFQHQVYNLILYDVTGQVVCFRESPGCSFDVPDKYKGIGVVRFLDVDRDVKILKFFME